MKNKGLEIGQNETTKKKADINTYTVYGLIIVLPLAAVASWFGYLDMNLGSILGLYIGSFIYLIRKKIAKHTE